MGRWSSKRRVLIGAAGLLVAVGCSTGPKELSRESSDALEAEAEACPPPDGTIAENCSIEIVSGIAQKCCKDPYSGTRNCTNFACQFHNLCKVEGIPCSTVQVFCSDGKKHATNIAWVDGKGWCWVDPYKGNVNEPCYPTKEELLADKDLVCRMIYKQPGCDCWVEKESTEPITPNTRPWQCKHQSSTYQECTGCCGNHWWYKFCRQYPKVMPPETCDEWHDQCLNECQGLPIK